MRRLCLAAVFSAFLLPALAVSAQPQTGFDGEEIKPYVKLMDGPWVGNAVSGGAGAYTIRVQVPAGARYVLGLFDNKIGRTGADARSAVVLVDGVNPLAPSETLPPGASAASADLSAFRKYPLDGVTFSARDTSGKDAFVKVVDAREEWEPGPVKPFSLPAGRSGANPVRIDVAVFAAPALPPVAGETVRYGAPVLRYAVLLGE